MADFLFPLIFVVSMLGCWFCFARVLHLIGAGRYHGWDIGTFGVALMGFSVFPFMNTALLVFGLATLWRPTPRARGPYG